MFVQKDRIHSTDETFSSKTIQSPLTEVLKPTRSRKRYNNKKAITTVFKTSHEGTNSGNW